MPPTAALASLARPAPPKHARSLRSLRVRGALPAPLLQILLQLGDRVCVRLLKRRDPLVRLLRNALCLRHRGANRGGRLAHRLRSLLARLLLLRLAPALALVGLLRSHPRVERLFHLLRLL